jgi:hypothetical protein
MYTDSRGEQWASEYSRNAAEQRYAREEADRHRDMMRVLEGIERRQEAADREKFEAARENLIGILEKVDDDVKCTIFYGIISDSEKRKIEDSTARFIIEMMAEEDPKNQTLKAQMQFFLLSYTNPKEFLKLVKKPEWQEESKVVMDGKRVWRDSLLHRDDDGDVLFCMWILLMFVYFLAGFLILILFIVVNEVTKTFADADLAVLAPVISALIGGNLHLISVMKGNRDDRLIHDARVICVTGIMKLIGPRAREIVSTQEPKLKERIVELMRSAIRSKQSDFPASCHVRYDYVYSPSESSVDHVIYRLVDRVEKIMRQDLSGDVGSYPHLNKLINSKAAG